MRQFNFIYVVGPASLSHWQNNEIRYSLRSIEFLNPSWIGTVGPEKPSFLNRGLSHIQFQPDRINRYRNTQQQLLAACQDPGVPENLILMNDDFIVFPSPVWDWKPTHLGLVSRKPTAHIWRTSVQATDKWCAAQGISHALNYEGHTPMPFLKSKAIPILENILGSQDILQFRTAYGNVNLLGGKQWPNAKRKDPLTRPQDFPFWSLKGEPTTEAKAFLAKTFTNPSKWEEDHAESRPLV